MSIVLASSSPFKRRLIIPTFMQKIEPTPMPQEEIVHMPIIQQESITQQPVVQIPMTQEEEIVRAPTIIHQDRIHQQQVPVPMTQEEIVHVPPIIQQSCIHQQQVEVSVEEAVPMTQEEIVHVLTARRSASSSSMLSPLWSCPLP